jgi:hypothetical protein
MTRSERIYRTLLRAYSEHTRAAYGEDMVQLFHDQLRDERSQLGKARVWLTVIADVAVTAPQERIGARHVAKVAEGPASEASRPVTLDLVIASIPVPFVVALLVVHPPYLARLFDNRVAVLGFPFGTVVLFLTTLLAVFGIFEARRGDFRDPRVQVIALAILLAPLVPMAVFGIVALSFPGLVDYVAAMTLFVIFARFRVLMLALVIPLVAWLLAGPWIILTLINLRL